MDSLYDKGAVPPSNCVLTLFREVAENTVLPEALEKHVKETVKETVAE